MKAHTLALSLVMSAAAVSPATTNETAQLPRQLEEVARLAGAITAVTNLTIQRATVWEGGWHLFPADVVAKIDKERLTIYKTSPTNQFVRRDAYYQEFVLANSFKGFAQYGWFADLAEAHSAFLYATTTTASPWYPNEELASKLTPRPDEVLFADSQGLILRQGAICIHVAVFSGPEDACMKHVIEIANCLLARLTAAQTNQ